MATSGAFGSSGLSPFGGGAVSLDALYNIAQQYAQPTQEAQPAPAESGGVPGGTRGARTMFSPAASGAPDANRMAQLAQDILTRLGVQVGGAQDRLSQAQLSADVSGEALPRLISEYQGQGMAYQDAVNAAMSHAPLADQQVSAALRAAGVPVTGVPGNERATQFGNGTFSVYTADGGGQLVLQNPGGVFNVGVPGAVGATQRERVNANPGTTAANAKVEASAAYKQYIGSNPTSSATDYRIRQQAAKDRGPAALTSFYKAVAAGKTF